MKIGFIGLGIMGYPIAGHLAQAGHQITVFNRSPDKSARWVKQYPGMVASNISAAVADAEIVFTCVLDDKALKEITLGRLGILHQMKPGSLLIDHSTISKDTCLKINAVASSKKIPFLDAPVSGGKIAADAGKLTIMAGGTPAAYQQAVPLFQLYASSYEWMGVSGSGCLAKMANQICAIAVLQGLAEGLRFIEATGLDGQQLLKVMLNGSAQSRQMEQRGPRMLQKDFKPQASVRICLKDLNICLKAAKKLGLQLPSTKVSQRLFKKLFDHGMADMDISSLIKSL